MDIKRFLGLGLSSGSSGNLYVFENGSLYAFNPNQQDIRSGNTVDSLIKDIVRDGYGLQGETRVINVSAGTIPRSVSQRLEKIEDRPETNDARTIHRAGVVAFEGRLETAMKKRGMKDFRVVHVAN